MPEQNLPEFPAPGTLFGYRDRGCSRHIVVLHPWGDNWRLTCFMPDGPSGHKDIEDGDHETLAYEMRWGQLERAAEVLDTLEQWTQTDEWAEGVDKLMILKAWNTCSYYGRSDLCGEIIAHQRAHTPAETLAWLPVIYRQLREEQRDDG